MLPIIILIGLLFIGIGFILTESNAKYLLSGYNTLSEEEQKKVDITVFIPFFRNFHLGLGASFIGIGLLLNELSPELAGVFIGVYPILAYIFFIWKSPSYSKGLNTQWNNIGIGVLVATLLLVVGLFYLGMKEDQLLVQENTIKIEGTYGEEINFSAIEKVTLVNKLPSIKSKLNGFAVGKINKGYFRTHDGERIKLVINSAASPFILLKKQDGNKIYYSSKNGSNNQIYEEIKQGLEQTAQINY